MLQFRRLRWGALACWLGAGALAHAQYDTPRPAPYPSYGTPPAQQYAPSTQGTWSPQPRPASPIPSSYPATPPLVPASAAQPSMPRPIAPLSPAANRVAGGEGRPVAPGSMAAVVQIDKRAPETINVGQSLAYEIIVRNPGSAAVFNLRVEDELPAGVRVVGSEPAAENLGDRLAWPLGTLEPGAERRIRVELQPGIECELRATATATFTAAAGSRTNVVRPKLAMTMKGPDTGLLGDQIPFRIQVSNAGSGPLTGLVLHDRLPAGLQHPQGALVEAELGTLQPGEMKEVTLRAVAAAGGPQVNDLTATADGGLEVRATETVNIVEPQLQLRRIGPPKGRVKAELTFELELTNPGSAPATNVMVADMLAEGVEFTNGSDGALFDKATRTITWKLGNLPAGSKKLLTYKIRASVIGDLVDRGVAKADRVPEQVVETAVLVEGVPALMLEVVDLEDPIQVGGDLTYEIRVVNQGSCPCTNVQITANVPEGLQPREATAPVGHRIAGQQIVFEPLTKLAVKADATYRIKVKGVNPGDYRFKVQMTCEQLSSPVNKEESSRVYRD